MNLENNGERMDIDFFNIKYENFDMYQKSHYKRYDFSKKIIEKNYIVGDMACGTGYGSVMMSQNCNKIFGFDIDKTVIEEIKNRYLNIENVEFENKNLLDITYENFFDMIVSFETVEHFFEKDIEKLFDVFYNSLKDDGILCFSTPYNQNDTPPARRFHKTFYINEEKIMKFLNKKFELMYFKYQDYNTHEVLDNLIKKDFIICVAKKINKKKD